MDYETYHGITLAISTAIAKEAKESLTNKQWVQDIPAYLLLRDDDEVSIYFNQLDDFSKQWLLTKLKEGGHRTLTGTVAGLLAAEKDPTNSDINSLVVLAQTIGQYIKRNAIDGWLYSMGADGTTFPWLVNNVVYREESNAPPCVGVYLIANSTVLSRDDMSRPSSRVVYFFAEDVQYRKVADILAMKGYIKETPELKQAYLESMNVFSRYVPQSNKQFMATGGGMEVDLENRNRNPERVNFETPVRVINDEELIRRKFFTRIDSAFWASLGNNFSEIPVHPMILCFNLETHTNMWIHINNLTEYQYDPGLRQKLVLPSDHRDLIDILTQDMDVLMDDIVVGKSGGTTILCKGAPGLGKTLTAEVYSEVVGRPLYRIHSGQLGVVSETVEANLDKILKRAQRWGAVMLIDEADVYIRRRGNDIDHNAVVASFLRTLEYFHGLLFLTTNRVDDVDDAIASRCIATIVYGFPNDEDAKQIWNVLSEQFQFTLSDKLINELVAHFSGVSGRDIKELLKLSSKWCRQKSVEPSLEVFRACAQFRGL